MCLCEALEVGTQCDSKNLQEYLGVSAIRGYLIGVLIIRSSYYQGPPIFANPRLKQEKKFARGLNCEVLLANAPREI